MNNKITVKANKTKRYFTLTTPQGNKYRTCSMSKEEFNESLYNTSNDWQWFLNNSNDYSLIK